jgi:hypothetical protein
VRAKRLRLATQASIPSRRITPASVRRYADAAAQRKEDGQEDQTIDDGTHHRDDGSSTAQEKDEGAMTRRLRGMSDEALETGGRSAQKAVSEAGFSEDLKRQLEERIASSNFRAEHRNAFAEAELPSTAGRHTREIATTDAWSGTESIHDASLRMLNDAHKPLKVGGTRATGSVVPLPRAVDTGRKSSAGRGVRLANARDRSGLYSSLKESDIGEQERQKRFQELKDRFSPHARAVVPGTINGLAALANERIENAIARGQFKNLPNRGKDVERDYNASSPFIDTTEYFLNKMIQKQEIVPPWIEKQQELVATASKFRSRLRAEWKRHAARMIASNGGTLQEQVMKAEAYAKAELVVNPKRKKQEVLSSIEDNGHVSQISLSGELKVSSPGSSDPVLFEEIVAEKVTLDVESQAQPTSEGIQASQTVDVPVPTPTSSTPPATHPFRDPEWERIEYAYHKLAVEDLNSKTRSYNLQAPELARKPYYSLERELKACFADVAPQLAAAIRERAIKPVRKPVILGPGLTGGGVMHSLVGQKVKVRDERAEKQYGFRQFWKDVWGAGEG